MPPVDRGHLGWGSERQRKQDPSPMAMDLFSLSGSVLVLSLVKKVAVGQP